MLFRSSNITVFAVLATVTILAWIASDVYRRLTAADPQVIPVAVISPLTPTLDAETLSTIERKDFLTEQEISLFVPTGKSAPKATPSPAGEPEATPSSSEESESESLGEQ